MNQVKILRRKSRQIMIGKVAIGGDAPITVQTMTKTDTRDVQATLSQIRQLEQVGCDIVRIAVPDAVAAQSLKAICSASVLPIVADIHFDHRLAIDAINNGVQALRLNPGNIRSKENIKEIVSAAIDRHIPIRVGVNAGSLDPDLKAKYGGVTPEALAESALTEVKLLEECGFELIKVAVKAFDIYTMIKAVEIVASSCDYPLHIGITESGLPEEGIVRSSIGIGSLLLRGIGDTIRVSLTDSSEEEVMTGQRILKSLGYLRPGPIIVSCPTCGRCEIPLQVLARQVQQRLSKVKEYFQVAVMGCIVNGPGEAEQADFGIAGGKDCGLVFRKGKVVRTLPSDQLVEGLMQEIFASLENDRKSEE